MNGMIGKRRGGWIKGRRKRVRVGKSEVRAGAKKKEDVSDLQCSLLE